MTNWLLLAFAAGLASNLYNFFSRYFLKDQGDASSFGWLMELVRMIAALIFISTDNYFVLTKDSIYIFVLLGIVEVVSIYLFMKMHSYSHLSISTIISRTRLIWIPILAFLILGEVLKTIDYIGIAILFFGLSITVSPHKIVLDKGSIYAYLSAFVVAVLNILMKFSTPLMSTSYTLLAMSFMSVLIFPFIVGKKRIVHLVKRNIILKILTALFNIVSMYLFIYALKIGDVSKVTAIYQGSMIFSVLAGIIFLKETQDAGRKIIGALITLGGALILTL
jgi:drug/metabolite transporter (DMT)-like permease